VREIRVNEIFNKVVEDILTHEIEKNKIKYMLSLIRKLIWEKLQYMSSNEDWWQT
jgi:hypothetical protein